MSKLFLFMMVTVDGYFEGQDHDISWHNVDAEFNDFAHEQNRGIGTLLFGHRTYDLMAGFWPTPQGRGDDAETAEFMTNTPKVVVSHQSFAPSWENTKVLSDDVAQKVRAMKSAGGKDIAIFGSNMLCVSLMEQGIVDEFRIMANPVAIGKGTPLFAGLSKRVGFRLAATRQFKSGNILNTYTLER